MGPLEVILDLFGKIDFLIFFSIFRDFLAVGVGLLIFDFGLQTTVECPEGARPNTFRNPGYQENTLELVDATLAAVCAFFCPVLCKGPKTT